MGHDSDRPYIRVNAVQAYSPKEERDVLPPQTMTCPASSTLHAATITPCTDPDVNLTIICQLSTVISDFPNSLNIQNMLTEMLSANPRCIDLV